MLASPLPQLTSLSHAHRMLRRLLSARGANASLVTVFIDGFFQQPVDVAKLFGIRAVQVSVWCVAPPPVTPSLLSMNPRARRMAGSVSTTRHLSQRHLISTRWVSSQRLIHGGHPLPHPQAAKYTIVIEEDLDVSLDFFR